jgi:hypothetical protein
VGLIQFFQQLLQLEGVKLALRELMGQAQAGLAVVLVAGKGLGQLEPLIRDLMVEMELRMGLAVAVELVRLVEMHLQAVTMVATVGQVFLLL